MRPLSAFILLITCFGRFALGQNYTIDTFAGGALPEDIPGLSASLGLIQGIAVDKAGNTYLALTTYNIVVKLDPEGNLTRVAGNGTLGTSGEFVLATTAQLDGPSGLALDSQGSLYIATQTSVRKVENGIITTVVVAPYNGGPQLLEYGEGLAIDKSDNLFVASEFGCQVLEYSKGVQTLFAGVPKTAFECGFSGDNGPATQAKLFNPIGLAVDAAGSVYIADAGSNRIRKVSNGIIATVVGDGTGPDGGPALTAKLNHPAGVAFDEDGNLYIGDNFGLRIRKVSGGKIATVAGTGSLGFSGDGGPATAAILEGPSSLWLEGLAFDPSGNLLIGDGFNYRLRRVASGIIDTIAGGGHPKGETGPSLQGQFLYPGSPVFGPDGDLYFADGGSNQIRKISNGELSVFAGSGAQPTGLIGDQGPATSAQLNGPNAIVFDSHGTAYIADQGNCRIRQVRNGIISTVAGNGTCGVPSENVSALDTALGYGLSIAVDSTGNLYISDYFSCRISKVAHGIITRFAGNGTVGEFCFSSGDNGPATSAVVKPSAIVIGPEDDLYVADWGGGRIRRISHGIITTVAGGGPNPVNNGQPANTVYFYADGFCFDSAGAIYVTYAWQIFKIQNGIINIIAGNGDDSFSGDGGPALAASLSSPSGAALGPDGKLYFADYSQRIRVLIPPPPVAITLTSIPPNLTLNVDGHRVTTPANLDWIPGATHKLNAPYDLSGTPGTRYAFSHWNLGNAATQVVTTPSTPATYTARFDTQYLLTTNETGDGVITPSTKWYDAGSTVSVAASPANGSYFVGFTGALSGTTNPQSITLNGPASVSASFGNYTPALSTVVSSKANGTPAE